MEKPVSAGRPAINKQSYFAQIQEWLSEGHSLKDITATALQKAVGGVYKRSVDALAEFKEGYEAKELADLPDLPEALPNLLNAAALEIWRVLIEEKNKEVAIEKEKAAKKVAQAESLNIELIARIDELTESEERFDERFASLKEISESWEGKYTVALEQVTIAREDIAAKNAKIETLEKDLERNTDLLTEIKAQLLNIEGQNKSKDEELQEAKSNLADAKEKEKELSYKLNDAESKLEESKANTDKILELTSDLATAQAQAEAAKSEVTKLDARLDALLSQTNVAQKEEEQTEIPVSEEKPKKKRQSKTKESALTKALKKQLGEVDFDIKRGTSVLNSLISELVESGAFESTELCEKAVIESLVNLPETTNDLVQAFHSPTVLKVVLQLHMNGVVPEEEDELEEVEEESEAPEFAPVETDSPLQAVLRKKVFELGGDEIRTQEVFEHFDTVMQEYFEIGEVVTMEQVELMLSDLEGHNGMKSLINRRSIRALLRNAIAKSAE